MRLGPSPPQCASWVWRQDTSEKAGLALILEYADSVLYWPTGGRKDKNRTKDGAEEEVGTETFVLKDLMRTYADHIQMPISTAKLAAADAAVDSSPAGSIEWAREPIWPDLEAPMPPSPPYYILFVGANNRGAVQLSLEKEVEEMQMHFKHEEGSRAWARNVEFKHRYFANGSDLSRDLRLYKPVILHFACHGHASALSLFEQELEAKDFLRYMSRRSENDQDLQLVVANACNSNRITQVLGEHVDFVIGHEGLVNDTDAIKFARELYGSLGTGKSLLESFDAAKMASHPYCMTGRRNAAEFRLSMQNSTNEERERRKERMRLETEVARVKQRELKLEAGKPEWVRERLVEKDEVKELREGSETERQRMKVLEAEVEKAHQPALEAEAREQEQEQERERWSQKDEVEKQRKEKERVVTLHGGNNVPDDDNCCELVIFLTSKGLGDIASRFCKTVGTKLKDDFMSLHSADFEDQALFCLNPLMRQKLIALTMAGIAYSFSSACNDDGQELPTPANSQNDDLDSSCYSSAETVSDCGLSEDDTDVEILATKHSGNPEEFQKHMLGFITTFSEYMAGSEHAKATETFQVPLLGNSHEWSYYMVMWMRFAEEAHFDELERRNWLTICSDSTQEKMLVLLDSILQTNTENASWKRAEFEELACNKKYAAAIFVTDVMVRRHLQGHADRDKTWEQDIVDSWFENGETSLVFLLRANRFLRKHFLDGICAVNNVVKIQSYVAFLWTSRLASLLLFEYVKLRKFEDVSTAGAAKQRGGANHDWLQGLSSFVSSVGHVFRLSSADMPARSAVPTIVQGLRCLAHLRDPQWEVKTARQFFHTDLLLLRAPAQVGTVHVILKGLMRIMRDSSSLEMGDEFSSQTVSIQLLPRHWKRISQHAFTPLPSWILPRA